MRSCCASSIRRVTTHSGTVDVVQCLQCDRGHCAGCSRTIADPKARICAFCGTRVVFA